MIGCSTTRRGVRLTALACFLFVGGSLGAHAQAVRLVPPPEPVVKPFISHPRQSDMNLNGIDDKFELELGTVARAAITGVLPNPPAVQVALQQEYDCELVFSRQITQAQIDTFQRLGGKISHIFQYASYGWTGKVPLGNIAAIRQAMGTSLVIVAAPKAIRMHMYEATRNSRVRPVWAPGFGGFASGFRGSPTINIAIVDTGVDGTHTDLAGRMEYWHDYSTDAEPNPRDTREHGSHVAGISLGSGAAYNLDPSHLLYTDSGNLNFGTGFFPSHIHPPVSPAAFSLTADWIGGGTTAMHLARKADGDTGTQYVSAGSTSGTTGFTLNLPSVNLVANNVYSSALLGNQLMTFYTVRNTVSWAPIGDGFSSTSGVAPLSNWAGFKVFTNAGAGDTAILGVAIDDLLAQRVAHNIKVANFSLGLNGSPGVDPTLRAKINTLAASGILPVCSAGNDGGASQTDDPGRAAGALTVGATNSLNQLTSYSSLGFTSTDSSDDDKPDVLAPGGSFFYSQIISVDSNSSDAQTFGFADARANDYKTFLGTSMAAPHVTGIAALVIQALESTGVTWNFNSSSGPMLVKMLICASSTETNTNREVNSGSNPGLGRAATPKDIREGYGIVNANAAIEAITLPLGGTNSLATDTTTGGVFDRRAWGRKVSLTNGTPFAVSLDVPSTADYDLYLYSGTPDAKGKPVILRSSVNDTAGTDEAISFTPGTTETAYLFIKRVSGSGAWGLFRTSATPTLLSISPNAVAAGGGSFTLTCRGTNFSNGSVIRWNGVGLTTTFDNQTQLHATVPSSNIAATGFAKVTVFRSPNESNTQLISIGKVNLVSTATFSRVGGQIDVVVTVRNTGTAPASGYALTKATLQNLSTVAAPVNTTTSLPKALSSIPAGGSTTVTVSFPGSVGTAGQLAELKLSLAQVTTSGSVSAIRTTLP